MNDIDTFDRTLVVLTALDVEYAAVRAYLTGVREYTTENATRYDVGTLPGSRTRIALGLTGKGNLVAAALTEHSIRVFRPVAVLFVGVAGGLRDDIRLGDVVVAERVYAYHGGREDPSGFGAYPRMWEAPHALIQSAHSVDRAGAWASSINPRPSLYFGSVAAGEVVLNSPDAPLARQLQQYYADSLAIEMESGGVASAGHLNPATPVLTVRGISDSAGGEKDLTDAQGWQPRAAAHAAAFAMALVTELGRSRPAMARRPWVLSGVAAVGLVGVVSGVLAGVFVGALAALAGVSFWGAALVGVTTRRWHGRRRAAGVAAATMVGIAAIVMAFTINHEERNAPRTIQAKSAYQLSASSDPLSNYGDKVDLDTGCPGWGPMHPRIGPPRCGELADLIIESVYLHAPDYQPRLIALPNGQQASYDRCQDRLVPPTDATGSVELAALTEGAWLCVSTDQGNIAAIRVVGNDTASLVVDFEVWKL
ncbi:MAG: hypothetical protein ACRDSK_10040 [Actinophytocola sp.]|uniref:5'-methylthioadenosine/S-adenosylhomocysteine nucleosidase family protein n=1 Tax=Actinophytocola sp. TaxID=1872138 RepID=UPI003D6A97B6